MPDYDLQIDGKHYNLNWTNPNPPTQQEVEGIVAQYRAKVGRSSGDGPPPLSEHESDSIAADPRFNTKLLPGEEKTFQQWKSKYAPHDSGYDYDLRGAFKSGFVPDPKTGHWKDTYKKPNHPTFSDQSQYAKIMPERAGSWIGDTYKPPKQRQDTTAAQPQFDPKQVAKESDRWFKGHDLTEVLDPDSKEYKSLPVPAQAAHDLYHGLRPETWAGRIPKMAPITQHVIQQKVDELKLQQAKDAYFNTLNEHANEPMKLAQALAKQPQNAKLLARLNQYKDPYVKRAVQEKAAEFEQNNQLELVNPVGSLAMGRQPSIPHFINKATGELQPPVKPSQGIGTLLRGPEGEKKAEQHPTGIQEIQNLALGTLDPETQAFIGATTLIPQITIPAKIAAAGMMGKSGVEHLKEGDTAAGAIDLVLAALVEKSGYNDIAEGAKARGAAPRAAEEARIGAAEEAAKPNPVPKKQQLALPKPPPDHPITNVKTETKTPLQPAESEVVAKADVAHKSNLLKQDEAARTAQENAESQARREALNKATLRGKKAVVVEQRRQAAAAAAKPVQERIRAQQQADADYAAWTRQEPIQAAKPVNAPESIGSKSDSPSESPFPSTIGERYGVPKPFSIVPDPLIEHPSTRGQANAKTESTVAESTPPEPNTDMESNPQPIKGTRTGSRTRGAVDFGPGRPGSPSDRFNKWLESGKEAFRDGKISPSAFYAAMIEKHPELKDAPANLKALYTQSKQESKAANVVAAGATTAAATQPADPVVTKVTEGIKSAQKVQKVKEQGYSDEKSQRGAAYLEALKRGGPSRDSERAARGNLSGPLPKPDFVKPELTDAERDQMHTKINTFAKWRYGNKPYNIAAANVALDKVLDAGQVPGNYELDLLRQVFGDDMAKSLKDKRGSRDFWDYLLGWQRFSILSGAATLGKLTAAAAERTAITPAEELLGVGLSKIPALGKASENAPRQGGFSPKAEAEALRAFFGKAMSDTADPGVLKDIKSKLKTGNSSLDKRFGTTSETHPFLDFFTRLHGALKLPAQRAEFYRSLTKRTEFAQKMGEDLREPEVQIRLGAEAYADSERAIFMQDNILVDKWSEFLNSMEAAGKGGRGVKVASRILMPIVRVPVNYAGEVSEYALGVPMAMLKVIRSKGNLTAAEADAVIRWSKKGSVGMGMFALGYMHPEWMQGEGDYVPGESPHKDKKFGDIKFLGYTIPGWALHNPAIELFQMGSTAHRVSSKLKQSDRDTGEQIRQTLTGTALEVPFMEEARTIGMATDSKQGYQKAVGAVGRSVLEPIIMQQIAAIRDSNKRRKPKSISDEMKMGIPGKREEVPLSPYQSPRFQP